MNSEQIKTILIKVEARREEELNKFPPIIAEELKSGYNLGFNSCKDLFLQQLLEYINIGDVPYTTTNKQPITAIERKAPTNRFLEGGKKLGDDMMKFITGNR